MIPASGFYGVLTPRARLQDANFGDRLPAPQLDGPGAKLCAWQGGALQALVAADGRQYLAFHGTLYNRDELQRELGLAAGAPLEEILFRAWERWPDSWVSHLDACFALAHWTDEGRDLRLHRDPSGALSLFHARTTHGGLAFASHLGTLLRLPGVESRIAPQGLHEYLRLLDITPPNTLFEGVRAVPPGEGVALDAHDAREERALTPSACPAIDASFEDALDALQQHLRTSIDHRLAGVARPAAFLSGGIDSSLLCAIASAGHPEMLALTVGFDLSGYDEAPIAQKIAAHLHLNHRVLRFNRREVREALAEAGRHAEQPVGDPTEPVTLLAFRRAREECDVVLDGTGADEQLGTMPPRHVRIAVAHASRLPGPARRLITATLRRMPALAGYTPLFDFDHPAEMLMRWRGFRRKEIENLCGTSVTLDQTRFFELFARFPRDAHFERYSALVGSMPSDRLSQAALITGLDVRFPFCAPEVDRYLRGLPRSLRWRQDEPKRILRALLARHIPPSIWDVPKHGFTFPLFEFLADEDFEIVKQYLLPGQWAGWQLLAPEKVAEYARRFIAGDRRLMLGIWALIVLATWLEGHFD